MNYQEDKTYKLFYLSKQLLHGSEAVNIQFPQPLSSDVTTDHLFPIEYLFKQDPEEMIQALFTGFEWWNTEILPTNLDKYDTLVAGKSFAIGSARENPVEAMKKLGIRFIFADSYARAFRMHATNWGIVTSSNRELQKQIESGYSPSFAELTSELSFLEKQILTFEDGLPAYLKAIINGEELLPQLIISERQSFPQTAVEKICTQLGHEMIQAFYPKHSEHIKPRYLKTGDSLVLQSNNFVSYDVFWMHTLRILNEFFAGQINVDPKRIMLFWDHFGNLGTPEAVEIIEKIQQFWLKHPDTTPGLDGVYTKVVPRYLEPGTVISGTDSHILELAKIPGIFPIQIGYLQLACSLATGGLITYPISESIKLKIIGELSPYCSIKDAIWDQMLGQHFSGSLGDGAIFEISGSGYQQLGPDEASILFNATTEFGAYGAVGIEPNWNVISHLRKYGTGLDNFSDEDLNSIYEKLQPDPKANYRESIEIDLGDTQPVIAGPNTHKKVKVLSDIAPGEIPDRIIINSCGGSELEILATLIEITKGNKIEIPINIHLADPLTRKLAESLGILSELLQHGIQIADNQSCGPCLGQGSFRVRPGEKVWTTSNRPNSKRMGDPTATAQVWATSIGVAATQATIGKDKPLTLQDIEDNTFKILIAKEKIRNLYRS